MKKILLISFLALGINSVRAEEVKIDETRIPSIGISRVRAELALVIFARAIGKKDDPIGIKHSCETTLPTESKNAEDWAEKKRMKNFATIKGKDGIYWVLPHLKNIKTNVSPIWHRQTS